MVLGSGFVALQAAWAAQQRGLQVTVVELLDQILPRVLDAAAARILHEQLPGVRRGRAHRDAHRRSRDRP